MPKKLATRARWTPEATGVLAVALGEATKTIPFITDALKCYEFTTRLGRATNTDDAEGEVISESDKRPTDEEIKAALGQFVGDILQVPPKFSAVKIDGQRAYKLARDGEDIEIAARPLWVESLIMLDREDDDHVLLELTCGKGGYVRSIARDLGESLGCFGHVRELRRIWSGPFDVKDGVSIEQIDDLAKTPEIDAFLKPMTAGLTDIPEVTCSAEAVTRLKNGNPGMVIASGLDYGDTCWVSHNGQPIAIGTFKGGELHPSRVFVLPDPA